MSGKRGREKGRKGQQGGSRGAVARRERAEQRARRASNATPAASPAAPAADDTAAAPVAAPIIMPGTDLVRLPAPTLEGSPSAGVGAPLSAPIEGITPRAQPPRDLARETAMTPPATIVTEREAATVMDGDVLSHAAVRSHADAPAEASHDIVAEWPVVDQNVARFARQLVATCDECEGGLAAAVQVRQEQEMAWLVLCDRGWPAHQMVPQPAIPVVAEWLACWDDFVKLPPKVEGIRDRFRLRGVLSRFEKVEGTLKPMLPAEVWRLVLPLDATGRATFSFILQGIQALEVIRLRAAESRKLRAQLIARFNTFREPAQALGLQPPEAPLDTAAWRAIAAAADRRSRQPVVP